MSRKRVSLRRTAAKFLGGKSCFLFFERGEKWYLKNEKEGVHSAGNFLAKQRKANELYEGRKVKKIRAFYYFLSHIMVAPFSSK